jgi:hypothetical protein
MYSPITPFWFKQRQCKAEPVGSGEEMLKVSGPNLAEAFIYIRREKDLWQAGLRLTADGPDVAVNEPGSISSRLAWDAAFELYRLRVIA